MAKRVAILFGCVFCLVDHGIASQCPLPWNAIYDRGGNMIAINYSMPCPYGTRLPGSVTWPKRSGSALKDAINFICVFWGYAPFLIMALSACELFVVGPFACTFLKCCEGMRRCCSDRTKHVEWRAGTRELSFAVFCIVIIIFNEGFLKRMMKQPRPHTSCCYSCGFPSGHSTYAVGFFTLMFLDGSYRVLSKEPSTLEEATEELKFIKAKEEEGVVDSDKLKKRLRRCNLVRFISVIPLSKGDSISHIEFVVFAIFWAFVLLPTPVSRIMLGDHSPFQIAVGASMGVLEAFLWFYIIIRRGQHSCNKYIGRTFFGFRHNFALPRQEVASTCVRMLAEFDLGKDVLTHEARNTRKEKLESMQEELRYYIDLTIDREWRARKDGERKIWNADKKEYEANTLLKDDLEEPKGNLEDAGGCPHFLSIRDRLLPDRVFLRTQFYTLKLLMEQLHEQLCTTFFDADKTSLGLEGFAGDDLDKLKEEVWDTSSGYISGKPWIKQGERLPNKMKISEAVKEAQKAQNCVGFYYRGNERALSDPDEIRIYFIVKSSSSDSVDLRKSCCRRTFTSCFKGRRPITEQPSGIPRWQALKEGTRVVASADIRLGRGGEETDEARKELVTVKRVTVEHKTGGRVWSRARLWDPVVREYLVAVKWDVRKDRQDKPEDEKRVPLWTRPSQLKLQEEGGYIQQALSYGEQGINRFFGGCPSRKDVKDPLMAGQGTPGDVELK